MIEVAVDKPLTPKEQKFAQKVLELGDKSAAYRAAYDAGGMQAKSIHVNACKLAKKPNVAARIAELENETAAESKLSRGMILEALMAEAGLAGEDTGAKEGGARVRALELMGKAVDGGIFTDRTAGKEESKSHDEVLSSLAATLGAMPLDALEGFLAQVVQAIDARKAQTSGRGNVVPIQQGASR